MMRLAAAAAAVVLFILPLLAAALPAVALVGALGLLLAAVGIAALWPPAVTAAACVFAAAYTAALWTTGPSVNVIGAVGFGLALVLLLEAVELARCARHATVDARVVGSQLAGWTVFGAATLGSAMLVTTLARGLAAAVPFAAAPLLAATGALGVVLVLAGAFTRVARRR